MVSAPDPPTSPAPGPRRVWPLLVALALVLLASLAGAALVLVRSERRTPLPEFGEGTLRVLVAASGSDRTPAEHCSLLAATAAQRARGLMTRRDLDGYAAMVFRFDEDVESSFYNRNVPIALSVAWFDSQGRWVGTKDLEPCPDMDGCPTIAPGAPYRYAVEVEKGGLARLGLGPGSQISFAEGC